MSPPISTTPQPRPLPPVNDLPEACSLVIYQSQGNPATYFIEATQGRSGQDLVAAIRRMIRSGEAREYREKELRKFPSLLSIEDYVWRYGLTWGFDQETVEMARQNALYYDLVVASDYGLVVWRREQARSDQEFTRYL
jgi:hypothetical protein